MRSLDDTEQLAFDLGRFMYVLQDGHNDYDRYAKAARLFLSTFPTDVNSNDLDEVSQFMYNVGRGVAFAEHE